MAKKKTTTKKSTEVKPAGKDIYVDLRKAIRSWTEWSKLTKWEKNSGKSAKYWRIEISKLAMRSYKAKFIEISQSWGQEDYYTFLKAAKKRMYDTDYTKLSKEFKVVTNEYYIGIGGFTGYNDWAVKRVQDDRTKYFSMDVEEQLKVENKMVRIVRDPANNRILNVIPLMKGFTAGEFKDIPEHSYMGSAIGMAIPVEHYKAATAEGEDSEHWNYLMPMVLNCNGEEFGNAEGENYRPLEAGKCYKVKLSSERGKKVGTETDFYYAFEGRTSESYMEGEDKQKQKITMYDGPRAFQYNLKLVNKDGELHEVGDAEFNFTIDELMEYAYNTWNLGYSKADEAYKEDGNNGLKEVPQWLEDNTAPKDKYGSGLYPIACEASVIEVRIKESTNGIDKPSYSIRLDDILDEKGVRYDDKDFTELSLYGVQFSEEQLIRFKTLAPSTRIKFIAAINKKPKMRIGGNIHWFNVVVSTASDDFSNVNDWVVEPEDGEEDFGLEDFEIGEE